MYVVTVDFIVKSEHSEKFLSEVMLQARNSLSLEEDCKTFDVCTNEINPKDVFLYEVYKDKTAFDLHLKSSHFKHFDRACADWIEQKTVSTWILQEEMQ